MPLTFKEIYAIVGVLLLIITLLLPLKNTYKILFSAVSFFLIGAYFLPKIKFLDILILVISILPFVVMRFKKDSIYKTKK